jgi:hypothetical protein
MRSHANSGPSIRPPISSSVSLTSNTRIDGLTLRLWGPSELECSFYFIFFGASSFLLPAYFMASLVVFLPEPRRGDAANSPDFPTKLALAPHFIVPAR